MALKSLLDIIVTDNFKIKPKAALDVSGLEDGRLDIKGGVLYTYDATRTKWLSVQRQTLIFGRSGTTADQYLNFASGGISSKSGYRMPRNACIVGLSVQGSTSDNFTIHIRKNDSAANIESMVVAGYGNSSIATNRELYTADYLQCYLEYSGVAFGVDDPIVMIELAWRGI
jgi:hypothetical protein